jgi:WD40 repeat protein
VVTASVDNTAQVWDATTGKPVTPPLQHDGSVYAAAFSPDGTRVVTASADKTARIWALPLDTGSLEDWRLLTRCSPFALVDGILTRNPDPVAVCSQLTAAREGHDENPAATPGGGQASSPAR